MPGPGFTQTFGGTVLYPAQSTYNNLTLTTNIQLLWPTELSIAGAPVVADIMDVTASVINLSISFSDATQASTGYTALFNNIGANTFTVKDSLGNTLATVASGQAWLIYLADNSTAAGVWRIFQMGAGVSSANAAALAGAGLLAITTTLNEFVSVSAINTNYVSTIADRCKALEWTGGVGTITLGAAGTLGTGWFCYVKNSGSGNVVVSPPAGTIDSGASVTFQPNNSAIIVCDGANFFTIGFGQTINSIFSFIQISLTGVASPLVLSGVQLNRISYQFTGVLTAPMVVVVPAFAQQYWIDNETTGAFTLSFESPTPGTITAVGQGQRNILYCDGTNVVPAVTFGSTGFVNGSAGAPSIFFAASPATGFYSPAANQLAESTSGTQRRLVSATGHTTVAGADDNTGATFTINGPSGATGTALALTSPFTSTAALPLLTLGTTSVGGFAILSIGGSGAVPGTSDFALLQNGSGGAVIINRASGQGLTIGTTGVAGGISIQANGSTVATFFAPGANSVVIGSSFAYSVGFTNITQNSATAGAATALPATPAGYLTVNVNGANQKIAYYAP